MYDFKVKPELIWAATVAALVVVGEALISLDPAQMVDWRTWAVGVIGGAARAAIAAVIAKRATS